MRTNIGHYEDELWDTLLGAKRNGARQFLRVLDAWYDLRPFHLAIGVLVPTGKIFEIAALAGYEGALLGKVRVGMTAGEAMKLIPDLHYNATEDGLLSTVHKGLALGLSEPEPSEDRVPSLTIQSISIFAPEMFRFWGWR